MREFANLIWVRLHTDEGLVGLGETFMGASAVEAYLHDTVAPKLLGTDPLQIEARNASPRNYLGWSSAGRRNARQFGDRSRPVGYLRQGARATRV